MVFFISLHIINTAIADDFFEQLLPIQCQKNEGLNVEQAIERVEWALTCGVLTKPYVEDPLLTRDELLSGAEIIGGIIAYPIFIKEITLSDINHKKYQHWKAPTYPTKRCDIPEGYTNRGLCIVRVKNECIAKRYWAYARGLIPSKTYRMLKSLNYTPLFDIEYDEGQKIYVYKGSISCEEN
tara:strand:+ start:2193 stop:2738 length:546 start_codon:yes stop_codon:yes gene_type:complete